MKKAILGAAILLTLPSAALARDARGMLQASREAMGLSAATAITVTAHGDIKDTGEAAGGNAPRPVVESYEQALDLQTPAMHLRIHRTNPDGTELLYGSEENQFVSGQYVWQQYAANIPPADAPPGAGAPPGGGAPPGVEAPPGGGPTIITNNLAELRQAQIWLNPAGFIAAALAADASLAEEGGNQVVTFTTGDAQTFAGTFDGQNLLTTISTTDPLTGEVLEAVFMDYSDFNGLSFPAHIAHYEGGETLLDLVVTAVDTSSAVDIEVPKAVTAYQPAPAA